jgi:hypothetical protein
MNARLSRHYGEHGILIAEIPNDRQHQDMKDREATSSTPRSACGRLLVAGVALAPLRAGAVRVRSVDRGAACSN